MNRVTITCDGACIPNPGKGAWAFRAKGDFAEWEGKGVVEHTTNNRMEMQAAIEGLLSVKTPSAITLRTDSMFVVYAVQRKNTNRKSRANGDLVHKLWAAMEPHEFTVEWVRGHAGDAENERVDEMANALCVA